MPALPYLVSPLTLDHDWLQQNLDRVQIAGVEDGTAIGSAIAACVNRLRDTPAKSKIVVLLTDGMNNSGKISPAAAAEAAKALGVKVYTIAAGVRGEAPVPVKDDLGNTQLVMAKVDVDEDTLQKIAAETGGQFYRATDTDSLKHIYANINGLEKSTRDRPQVRALAGTVRLGLDSRARRARPRRGVGANALSEAAMNRNTIHFNSHSKGPL